MIKLDIDTHQFDKWLRHFRTAYTLLRSKEGIFLTIAKVKETRKGYHVYIAGKYLPFRTILFFECLLGSDPKKQLYAYTERADILFQNKNNGRSIERSAKSETKKLNRAIRQINRAHVTHRIYEFKSS